MTQTRIADRHDEATLVAWATNNACAARCLTWTNVPAGVSHAAPSGAAWHGMVAEMLARQAGNCAACAKPLNGDFQVCHRVAATDCTVCGVRANAKRGYVDFNNYLAHKSCNDDDARVFGSIVPLWSLRLADTLARVTSRAERLASAEHVMAERERVAAERLAERMKGRP